jgi:hypothetical protein
MDTKLTLHFDSDIIEKAKAFAEANNISLSRLTEFLYRKITSGGYNNLEDFPISDWVFQVSEGEAEYKRRSRKKTRDEFHKREK